MRNGEAEGRYAYTGNIRPDTFIEEVTSLDYTSMPPAYDSSTALYAGDSAYLGNGIYVQMVRAPGSDTNIYARVVRVDAKGETQFGNPHLVGSGYRYGVNEIYMLSGTSALLSMYEGINPPYKGRAAILVVDGLELTKGSIVSISDGSNSPGLYQRFYRLSDTEGIMLYVNDKGRAEGKRLSISGTSITASGLYASPDLPMTNGVFKIARFDNDNCAVIQGNHADLVQFSDNEIIVRNKVYFSNIPTIHRGSSVLTIADDRCLLIANTADSPYRAAAYVLEKDVSELSILKETLLQDAPKGTEYGGMYYYPARLADGSIYLMWKLYSPAYGEYLDIQDDGTVIERDMHTWISVASGEYFNLTPLTDGSLRVLSTTVIFHDFPYRLGRLVREAVERIDGITRTTCGMHEQGRVWKLKGLQSTNMYGISDSLLTTIKDETIEAIQQEVKNNANTEAAGTGSPA